MNPKKQNIIVAIPVYNGQADIGRTLKSVINLTSDNWTCFVIDDGSTDKTVERAQEFAQRDDRIKVFERPRGGASAQRNFALERAYDDHNVDWLVWLDCGDALEPDFLKKRIDYIEYELGLTSNDPCALIGGRNVINERPVLQRFLPRKVVPVIHKPDWMDGKGSLENLLSFSAKDYVSLHFGGVLSRKSIEFILNNKEKITLYPESMFNGPDYIACTRMAYWGINFYFHSEPLINIYIVSNTTEQGASNHKLIARFDDFCRGGEMHEPYYGDQDVFRKNSSALRFYNRGLLIRSTKINSPKKQEYVDRSFEMAEKYNVHVQELAALISLSPDIECKKNLLKTFDTTSSDITWVNYNDVEVALSKTTTILRRLLTHGSYESQLIAKFRRKINSEKITHFIDAGASAGVVSAILAKGCATLTNVFCFEPTPKHFDLLRLTMQRLKETYGEDQQLPEVTLLQKALVGTNADNDQTMLISEGFGGANRLLSTVSKHDIQTLSKGFRVKNIHLPDQNVIYDKAEKITTTICDKEIQLKDEKIAIKIDIEGAELEALKGMEQLLSNNECFLMVEVSKNTADKVIELLNDFGYEVEAEVGKDLFFQPAKNKTVSPRRRKKLYIHAGMIKTGSSSLQYFLEKNYEQMASFGIRNAYGRGTHQKVKAALSGCVEELQRFNIPQDDREDFLYSVIDTINMQQESYPDSDFYLTHENLFQTSDINIGKNKWFQAIDLENYKWFVELLDYDVKLIIYLRRQDLLLRSAYNTYVTRFQLTETFEEWEKPDFDYANMLDKLALVFGKNNIIVRVFEKRQMKGGSTISDFLDLFDLKITDGFSYVDSRQNKSLSLEAEEYIRTELTNIDDYNDYLNEAEFVARVDDKRVNKELPYLNEEEAKALLEKYYVSNEKVARDYLNRSDGILFYEGITSISKAEMSKSRYTIREAMNSHFRTRLDNTG